MNTYRCDPSAPEVEAQFRPVPFWSWNDQLEKAELVRQIHEMHDAGIGGFFMHARGGLKTPYMGKEWMEDVALCVREAVKLGMKPWLYDENGWPSGFGDGEVNALGEEYQSKHAELRKVAEISDAGKTLAWYDEAGKRLPGRDGAAFALQVFVNPFYVDNLNPAVVAKFIEKVYERYWKELPGDVRRDLAGIFTDEPQLSVRGIPWSPVLADAYRKNTGKTLIDVFPELVLEVGDWRHIRIEFWKTATVLFRDSYIDQLGAWCRKHRWQLTGHHLLEESYDSQLNVNGAVMPQYEGYSIPGIDHLSRVSTFLVPDIQVASAAAQNNQKQIIVETFGCSGWNYNMRGMKWLYQQHLVYGVNLLCQHLESYSIHGLRKRDYPASVFYQHPMWRHVKKLNDAFARVGRMLATGETECEVLLIHGESSAWMHSHGSLKEPRSKELFKPFFRLSSKISEAGIPFHYGDEIMLAEKGAAAAGVLELGAMRYSCVVIPPVENLLGSTLRLLREFSRQGGRIVRFAPSATQVFLVDGKKPAPKELDFWNALPVCKSEEEVIGFLQTLPALGIRNVGGTQGRVRGTWRHFPKNKERWYYLADFASLPENRIQEDYFCTEIYSNVPEVESGCVLEVTLPFPAERAEVVDQESGEVEKVLSLFARPDGKSVFLTGIPASGSLLIRAKDLPETKTVDLTEKWRCRTSENVMTLEKVTYRLGDSGAWERETDTLSLFNRLLALPHDTPLEMRYAFEVLPELDAKKADLKIAVEPDENAAYFLNGKRIAKRFLPGYFLDRAIRMLKLPASAIKTGRNFFEVRTHFRQSAAVRAAVERAKKFESEANKLYFDSEVEAVYLLGKFGCFCKGSTKKEKSGSYYLDSPFVIGNMPDAIDSGKSVLQGLPFFTGTLVLEKEFTLSRAEAAHFKRLRWSRFKANAVQVAVNGREFPVVFAPPYELDVSSALKAGKNRIELRLETSPRNTLGPFHTNETEPLSTSPGSFLTERDLLGWYAATDVPEYGVLEPSPEEITMS